MADRLIRVGHMGWVHEPEMREAIAAIVDSRGSRPATRATDSRPRREIGPGVVAWVLPGGYTDRSGFPKLRETRGWLREVCGMFGFFGRPYGRN